MSCEQQLQLNEVNGVKDIKNVFHFSSGPLREDKSQTKSNREATCILYKMRQWTFDPADILTCGSNNTVVANNINGGPILFK